MKCLAVAMADWFSRNIMTPKRQRWLVVWLMAAVCGSKLCAIQLPVEDFFRGFEFHNAKLSPGGKHLAALRGSGTGMVLLTVELASFQSQVACSGEISDYDWVSDGRLVVQGGGQHFGGMIAVDRDGANVRKLLEPIANQFDQRYIRFYEVIHPDPTEYPFVPVASLEFDTEAGPRQFPKTIVRRVNVLTGKSELVEKIPGDVFQWLADRHHAVRVALVVKEDRGKILYRPAKGQPWETVADFDLWEEDLAPFGFAADNRRVYVAARRGHDTLGLYLFDPATREFGDCLWRHERYDLDGIVQREEDGTLLAASYEGGKRTFHWFDREAEAQFAKLEDALPGLIKVPVGEADHGTTQLYYTYSDRMAGAFYLFRPARNQLQRLAECAPWLNPTNLAEYKPITYPARDGLKIEGYLTLPPGREARNLPLVILPHGGPWVRDTWCFDPEAQFLANRGYAVLQPNYRSSTGYGAAFVKAGYKQYGLKIQDDITDGVQWAIAQGIADPKRVAIFGCSFGGYAAMVGLTQTPELYRCGINYAGVTDLNHQLRHATEKAIKQAHSFARLSIGDFRKEKDLLKDVSPLSHVRNLQAPVLLAYGGQDRVVDIEQGRRLVKELKARKKPYEFIYEPHEGHGFTTPANVFKLYNRIDAFLGKHLK